MPRPQVLLTIVIVSATVQHASAFSLSEWLNNPPYAGGTGIVKEQIDC